LHLLVVLMLSLMLVACASQSPQTGVGLSPAELGRIGARINRSPDRADEILSRHGLTQSEFEKAIREVSSNAEMSERYHEAFRSKIQSQ